MNSVDQHKENLMRELNQVLKDAEDLIKNSEQQAGEGGLLRALASPRYGTF